MRVITLCYMRNDAMIMCCLLQAKASFREGCVNKRFLMRFKWHSLGLHHFLAAYGAGDVILGGEHEHAWMSMRGLDCQREAKDGMLHAFWLVCPAVMADGLCLEHGRFSFCAT